MSNLEEHCLPVRNTDDWSKVKIDPLFAEIAEDCKVISVEEIVANRGRRSSRQELISRSRPSLSSSDVEMGEEEGEISSPDLLAPWNIRSSEVNSPEKGSFYDRVEPLEVDALLSRASSAPVYDGDDDDEPYSPPPAESSMTDPMSQSQVALEIKQEKTEPILTTEMELDETERDQPPQELREEPQHETFVESLHGEIKAESTQEKPSQQVPRDSPQERALDVKQESISEPRHLVRPELIPQNYARDNAQEDILAQLGVTGSAKPVFAVPSPAHMALPERLLTDVIVNMSMPMHIPGPPYIPPPPPPPPMQQSAAVEPPDVMNPWKTGFGHDGCRDSPKSEASQHTLAGSDFQCEEPNGELEKDDKAFGSPQRNDNLKTRKRSRSESAERDGVRRQKDDISSRLRKRQPKVAAAYG